MFALVLENKVVNIIICDSKELAEELTSLEAIEIEDGQIEIGWTKTEFGIFPPKPYESWILTNHGWAPPSEKPGEDYIWDDASNSWMPMDKPFDSWLWDEDLGKWYPPTNRPQDARAYVWDESSQSWKK